MVLNMQIKLLIIGLAIFIIGNIMFLSWILNLGFDNFSFQALVDRTEFFLYCANYPYLSSPCLLADSGSSAILIYGIPTIWLVGLGLIIYGSSKSGSQRKNSGITYVPMITILVCSSGFSSTGSNLGMCLARA